MSKKMKKQNAGGGFGFGIIVVIVLAIIIIAGAITTIPVSQTADFALLINNKYVLDKKKDVVLQKGDVIEIDLFKGSGEVDVEVYAIKNTQRDLTFTWNGTEYFWNDSSSIANCPVSSCFEFEIVQPTEKENGKITYVSGDEYAVVEKLIGADDFEFTKGQDVAGDIFRMDVTLGTTTISVYFSCTAYVNDIELDKSQIIF